MIKIYLIRHGEAIDGWTSLDPGLSKLGKSPIKDLNKRVDWLKRVLPLNWEELEKDKESKLSNIDYYLWRKKIISKIISFKNETVIFTHFVVINNVIGKITNSKKVINFYPDNCSITEIGIKNNKMELIKLGNNSISKVN